MEKQKQIEEMCAIMADASYAACEDTPLVPESAGTCDKVDCHRCKEARMLIAKGYRKASEVARNIFGNLRILGYIDFDGNFCIRKDSFEELEKIYTEDGETI